MWEIELIIAGESVIKRIGTNEADSMPEAIAVVAYFEGYRDGRSNNSRSPVELGRVEWIDREEASRL